MARPLFTTYTKTTYNAATKIYSTVSRFLILHNFTVGKYLTLQHLSRERNLKHSGRIIARTKMHLCIVFRRDLSCFLSGDLDCKRGLVSSYELSVILSFDLRSGLSHFFVLDSRLDSCLESHLKSPFRWCLVSYLYSRPESHMFKCLKNLSAK